MVLPIGTARPAKFNKTRDIPEYRRLAIFSRQHPAWITLHDNPDFRDFAAFLRAELDRVGPAEEKTSKDFFLRAVALERAFFDAAYESEG